MKGVININQEKPYFDLQLGGVIGGGDDSILTLLFACLVSRDQQLPTMYEVYKYG